MVTLALRPYMELVIGDGVPADMRMTCSPCASCLPLKKLGGVDTGTTWPEMVGDAYDKVSVHIAPVMVEI